jgi:hypothetical protein
MTEIDRVLEEAGDRWREAQPAAPALDVTALIGGQRPARRRSSVLAGAAVVMALVVGFAFGRLTSPGPSSGSGGGPPEASASPGVARGSASQSPSPSPRQSASPSPSPSPGSSLTPTAAPICEVTRPEPVFAVPKPFPSKLPDGYRGDWWGSAALWTILHRDGEVWRYLPQSADGLSQKTFWFSTDWNLSAEPEPAITVIGRRLDGPGTFGFSPGTNAASVDFGTAMLVGIDVPTIGCWEIIGRYRAASLSYVVLVEDPQPN